MGSANIQLMAGGAAGQLLAASDLHVTVPENQRIVEDLWPASTAD